MEYVASRPFPLPKEPAELADRLWYNLWQKKLWPYNELAVGDTIYWYETKTRQIVWQSQVTEVSRSWYESKDMLPAELELDRQHPDLTEPYTVDAPKNGYYLAWRVRPVQRLMLPKPGRVQFPRNGWLRVDEAVAQEWLQRSKS
jgi:hypothetical protein